MFKSFFREFKEFAVRGNVLDMAIGIIIGGAFGKIVSSFVDNVMMPPLGFVIGRVDFRDKLIRLGTDAAGKPVEWKLGLFLQSTIDFVIVAFAIFLMLKAINRMRTKEPPPPPNTKECPHCCTAIPLRATRCAHCTSDLKAA
jgi:large conductance mechanosensitive channel